jgi:hypothetical protein
MNIQYLIFCVSFLLLAGKIHSEENKAERLIFPFLPLERQSSVLVTADLEHPKPCLPEYTNLLSNSNLFSLAEQEKLKAVALKYKNVTTNSGPYGTVFKGFALRQEDGVKLTDKSIWIEAMNTFSVACFTHTNSGAKEELASFFNGEIIARFRTQTGDGYDVLLIGGVINKYQEYKNGLLDGLFVEIHDPNNLDDDNHCISWARFTKGKICGKYLMWDDNLDNQIVVMAEFKKPFDVLRFETMKMDLAWEKAPAFQTNSTPSSP